MKTKKTTNLKNVKKKKPKKQTKPNTKKPQKKTTLKKETIFTKINNWLKKRGLSPIISVILLVVVSVILVTLILSWGKNYVVGGVKDTKDILQIKPSDASFYVHTKSINEGTVHFNYFPPTDNNQKDIFVESYIVSNIPEMTEPVEFKETIKLSNTNVLELPCLYEYASTTPDLYIQLITTDDTYIDLKIKDQGMVCVSGGEGTENYPYVICSASDLNSIRGPDKLSKNYVLGKDIDLGCFSRNINEGWIPIGKGTAKFTGTFDGKNHTISNLYINRPGENNIGSFGYVGEGSKIKNLKLKDVNISGNNYVGGFAGYNQGDINNSSVTGSIFATTGEAGGLIGNNHGAIENCHVIGNISDGYSVGGLTAVNYSSIKKSFAIVEITGERFVGGLVGINETNGELDNCYAIGNINANDLYIGGLIGTNFGQINNSYAVIDVTGFGYLGGLVGTSQYSSINNSYAMGDVIGQTFVGGLVGSGTFDDISNSYAAGYVPGGKDKDNIGGLMGGNIECKIENSYWDKETTGQDVSAGGEGLTTRELKNLEDNFPGLEYWNFETVWSINSNINEGYPHLIDNPPR